jgi:hypothetical protein
MKSFLHISKKSNTIVISFAGHDIAFGGIPRFEFVNFFNKHFSHINRQFYVDNKRNSYHCGIEGISNNIDETVKYLKTQITGYQNIIFIGVSSGGYAAILFGSLLNITHVLAFIPQTVRKQTNIDERFRDISIYINDTTQYHLYGNLAITDKTDPHHISQCERIEHFPNVDVIKKEYFNVKQMRDSGELYNIISSFIS